jgi:hypothetical protein
MGFGSEYSKIRIYFPRWFPGGNSINGLNAFFRKNGWAQDGKTPLGVILFFD